MSQILLDEYGYIKEYALIGQINNGIDFDNFPFDLEDFQENYRSYKYIDGALYKNEEKAEEIKLEEKKEILRLRRVRECFDYINRGSFWYDTLEEYQIKELKKWYQDWLNVTDTLEVPTKPAWLKINK